MILFGYSLYKECWTRTGVGGTMYAESCVSDTIPKCHAVGRWLTQPAHNVGKACRMRPREASPVLVSGDVAVARSPGMTGGVGVLPSQQR